jgi:precorrin-4 methylase
MAIVMPKLSLTSRIVCLVGLFACGIASAQSQPAGKFYIVGMGAAPDLITVRAQNVIARADVLIGEKDEFDHEWAAYAKGKQVWELPHHFRRFYGIDPKALPDPEQRAQAEKIDTARRQFMERIRTALAAGKVVASLQGGDPMMYGMTLFLEMLPPGTPTEIVPGVGAFQAASAALKHSPPYGYDTSAVILTMHDWQGRTDENEKLMAAGSTMVFYTMGLDYPLLFAQLRRFYLPQTPVAVVCDAGDPEAQRIVMSTVGRFLEEVDPKTLPQERHMLFVGKFLTAGQARKDFLARLPPSMHE